jgi:predicted dehydrogenase
MIRIGIVGCGALTRIFYLPVLKKLSITPGVLVDSDIEGVKELAKTAGVANIAVSLEVAAGQIDAAIIATPNFLHVAQAKYLLEKGKHVLLEKPMAGTEKEACELIAASQNAGKILQIGMMRRFWKINRAVKKMLEDNVLGKLETISMQEGGVLNWPVQSAAVFNPVQSLGGVFIDTGSHTLDLLNWWIQDNDFELQYTDDNHGGVDADCELRVDFKSKNVKAEVKLSRIRNMPNEFLLSGTRGRIKLKPWQNVFETSDRRIEKYIYAQYPLNELKQQTFEDLFTEQVNAWVEAIQKDTKPPVDAESVLTSIIMLEQGYKTRRPTSYAWN